MPNTPKNNVDKRGDFSLMQRLAEYRKAMPLLSVFSVVGATTDMAQAGMTPTMHGTRDAVARHLYEDVYRVPEEMDDAEKLLMEKTMHAVLANYIQATFDKYGKVTGQKETIDAGIQVMLDHFGDMHYRDDGNGKITVEPRAGANAAIPAGFSMKMFNGYVTEINGVKIDVESGMIASRAAEIKEAEALTEIAELALNPDTVSNVTDHEWDIFRRFSMDLPKRLIEIIKARGVRNQDEKDLLDLMEVFYADWNPYRQAESTEEVKKRVLEGTDEPVQFIVEVVDAEKQVLSIGLQKGHSISPVPEITLRLFYFDFSTFQFQEDQDNFEKMADANDFFRAKLK